MTSYIKDTKTGRTFTLEVMPHYTIENIKEQIYQKTKIAPSAQNIIFAGNQVKMLVNPHNNKVGDGSW